MDNKGETCKSCEKWRPFMDKKRGLGHCFSLKNSDDVTHKNDWCEDYDKQVI
jgi:hypothetical protein